MFCNWAKYVKHNKIKENRKETQSLTGIVFIIAYTHDDAASTYYIACATHVALPGTVSHGLLFNHYHGDTSTIMFFYTSPLILPDCQDSSCRT